jgi:hypothetical protein
MRLNLQQFKKCDIYKRVLLTLNCCRISTERLCNQNSSTERDFYLQCNKKLRNDGAAMFPIQNRHAERTLLGKCRLAHLIVR